MKTQIFIARVFFLAVLLFAGKMAVADESESENTDSGFTSLESLLQSVKSGRVYDNDVNAERLLRFKQNKNEQRERLNSLKQEQKVEEDRSQTLEAKFNKNDEVILDLEEKLDDRLGSIKELFGVLQQVSSDAYAQLSSSVSHVHHPERAPFLLSFSEKMGQTKNLPKISEIEQLWFELQREMVLSSGVVNFESTIVNSLGEEVSKEITRVGLFNLSSDGKYLQYIPETGRILEYAKQPLARYTAGAKALADAEHGQSVEFSIDPTRGQLLSLLVKAPDLKDRIQQGGIIGYLIICLGILAVGLAVWRLLSLSFLQKRINTQIKHFDEPKDNPLGRIISAYQNNKNYDVETIELKLGEAILEEAPKVTRYIPLLKIIAAIAPLMGLLGTVTGMIITFQAITLFGAGDPKLMANGISQALMTTVLGLCVAIPTLLLHNLVQTRAKKISEVLEKESIALVAAHKEELEQSSKQPG